MPIPAGVFPGFGNAGPWVTSFVSLRFTVFDGDTATPEEIDFDHLFPTFGIPGTTDTLHLPMALNGFGNQRLDTVTNTLELSGDPVLGSELARFLARSDGSLRFFIRDIDEGGNRLNSFHGRNSACKPDDRAVTSFTENTRVFLTWRNARP